MSGVAWMPANQAFLTAAARDIRTRASRQNGASDGEAARAVDAARAAMPAPPALDTIGDAFGLTTFERDLLLLCASVELEPDDTVPTFGRALATLREPHWSALSPSGPLRHWRLIEVLPGDALVSSPLRIDERVLHALTGVHHLDPGLEARLRAVPRPDDVMPTHRNVAERLTALWRAPAAESGLVELTGPDAGALRDIAAEAAHAVGRRLWRLHAQDVPADAAERDMLVRLWHREIVLSGGVLLVDAHGVESATGARPLIDELEGRAAILTAEPLAANRHAVRIDVGVPPNREFEALWARLVESTGADGRDVSMVSAQFRLSVDGVRAVARQLAVHADGSLWDAAREQSRRGMEGLAERVEPVATWDDLVLPGAQKDILRQVAASAARRATVYDEWGFGGQGARGLGISVLFAGASGTGKTMAAEVLARELRLDLYRIDLSRVVSKYIGETEKNLARVFDAAEQGGSVLLFDEADALFGRRSEVKDSHDRYANIEVSYLLQRMESYRGLAILTTNTKGALDPAFLRRLRYVVQFPFPDTTARQAIWERVFPAGAPCQALDAKRLARLDITGGSIRNIAVNAAFLAAAEEGGVRMDHLLRAARAEYAKLEKPLTGSEVAGWT